MSNRRVLLVEDDILIGADLSDRLTSFGLEVFGPFQTGNEALNFCDSQNIDLAILDIELKGEMNGITLSSAIRSKQEVPVIFLTKAEDDQTLQEVLKSGYAGFIGKPFKNIELQTNIWKALEIRKNHTLDTSKLQISDRIFLRNGTGQFSIMLSKISYIEANREVCKIFIDDCADVKTVDGNLSKILSKLAFSELFERCHKSYAVNLKKIKRINSAKNGTIKSITPNKKYLVLQNDIEIPLSSTYKPQVLKRLKFL